MFEIEASILFGCKFNRRKQAVKGNSKNLQPRSLTSTLSAVKTTSEFSNE
jgi:hypothetical protein